MQTGRASKSYLYGGAIIGTLAVIDGAGVQAAEISPAGDQELRALVVEQTRRLEALRQKVAEEEARLAEIRQALGVDILRTTRGGTDPNSAANQPPPEAAQPPQTAVGQAPEPAATDRPPAVAPIFDQPGVLTPRGKVVLEPGLQYSYSSSNRVSLVGYTIIPALTIGLIDVREIRRNTWMAAMTGRWGITNRLEIEAKVPYVYRSDTVLSRPQNVGSAQDELFSSSGSGIGDIEFTGRYQLNDGGIDRPYYVGTLRFKTRTGRDPFEVETVTTSNPDATATLQNELPTGSGFYTLQPGLTVLYPSDPAVFFGSISYQYNFKRSNVSMNTTTGSQFVGDVQPGGVFGFNFGMGLALNDRSSFSIGYDHASVGKLRVNGQDALNTVRTQLGTLLLGYSQRINKSTTLNVSVGAGVTRDTPDVTLAVRLPILF